MDNNGYSLADIATATGAGANEGLFGGSGMWIFALLILMIIGGGGFGFGNNNANARSINEELLMNSQFNNLSNAVGDIGNRQFTQATELTKGICELGYTQAQLVNGLQNTLGSAINGVATQIANNQSATQQAINDVRFDMANYNASIQANSTANAQKILEAISQNKIESLQNQVNQLSLQSALCGIPRISTYAFGTYPYSYPSGCGCSANI